jgi:polysaccharide export outer membrane protein
VSIRADGWSLLIKEFIMTNLSHVTLIGLFCASVSACVTPNRPASQDICQLTTSSECHYFGQNTPYDRQISAQRPNNLKLGLIENVPINNPYNNANSHLLTKEGVKAQHLAPGLIDSQWQKAQLKLSVGDKLEINILNGEDFSKAVEIDADGNIYLPFIQSVSAKNLTLIQLNDAIRHQLIVEKLMQPAAIRISIVPISWAPINITTSGAVYEPGQHMINKKQPIETKDDGSDFYGDQATERSIDAALRSSGGIRPDADLTAVNVIRDNRIYRIDLTGVLTGESIQEFTLMAGDKVYVPSTNQFNDELARPSPITTPGIRVFMSNLTQPASSNSQSAVDREATRFPYGTRLLHGAIAANCVGGAQSTNASRYILLVTKNPLSNQMDVVERSIDGLIQQSWKNNMNPVLLPGDGIACYDSRMTNFRELARSLTDVIIPSSLIGWL